MRLSKLARLRNLLLLLLSIWMIFLFRNILIPSMPKLHFWIIAIDFILLISSLSLFINFGTKSPTSQETYYPPDKYDSAQIGYILDGYIDNMDIISLLMYWGVKGLIRIETSTDGIWFKRIKKMPETFPIHQRELFSQLFHECMTVQMNSLVYKFFLPVSESKYRIEQYFSIRENHIYSAESLVVQRVLSTILAAPTILCFIATYTHQFSTFRIDVIIPIAIISILIALTLTLPVKLLVQIVYHWQSQTTKQKIQKTSFALLYLIGIFSFFMAYTYQSVQSLTLVSIFTTILITLLLFFTRKRTPQGEQWKNDLLSLKSFMVNASQETIIRLHDENPDYYYEILPYAYVMGVSKEWSEKFNTIAFTPPKWFIDFDNPTGTYLMFHESLYINFKEITDALISTPPVKIKN